MGNRAKLAAVLVMAILAVGKVLAEDKPKPNADVKESVKRLKLEEKKLSNEIDYSRKCAAYWQKKYDESLGDSGKLPNLAAARYVLSWEQKALNAQQRLETVQEKIVDLESK
jgi:hypothetical protein